MPRTQPLIQAYGARERVHGIGILTADDPTPWIWERAAGDAVDIASVQPADVVGPQAMRLWTVARA